MSDISYVNINGTQYTIDDLQATQEIADVRVGADGQTYASAGEAVRAQVEALSDGVSGAQGDISALYDQADEIRNSISTIQENITAIRDDIVVTNANIAPDFSTGTAYAIGDYCMYDGSLYKCTTAHTGAWNAADFTAVTVTGELDEKASESDTFIVPEGVVKIPNNYFKGKSTVKTIDLPSTLKSIGENAFYGCTSLQRVKMRSLTPPKISASSVANLASINPYIYTPMSVSDEYEAASGWSSLKNAFVHSLNRWVNDGDICFEGYIDSFIGDDYTAIVLRVHDDTLTDEQEAYLNTVGNAIVVSTGEPKVLRIVSGITYDERNRPVVHVEPNDNEEYDSGDYVVSGEIDLPETF